MELGLPLPDVGVDGVGEGGSNLGKRFLIITSALAVVLFGIQLFMLTQLTPVVEEIEMYDLCSSNENAYALRMRFISPSTLPIVLSATKVRVAHNDTVMAVMDMDGASINFGETRSVTESVVLMQDKDLIRNVLHKFMATELPIPIDVFGTISLSIMGIPFSFEYEDVIVLNEPEPEPETEEEDEETFTITGLDVLTSTADQLVVAWNFNLTNSKSPDAEADIIIHFPLMHIDYFWFGEYAGNFTWDPMIIEYGANPGTGLSVMTGDALPHLQQFARYFFDNFENTTLTFGGTVDSPLRDTCTLQQWFSSFTFDINLYDPWEDPDSTNDSEMSYFRLIETYEDKFEFMFALEFIEDLIPNVRTTPITALITADGVPAFEATAPIIITEDPFNLFLGEISDYVYQPCSLIVLDDVVVGEALTRMAQAQNVIWRVSEIGGDMLTRVMAVIDLEVQSNDPEEPPCDPEELLCHPSIEMTRVELDGAHPDSGAIMVRIGFLIQGRNDVFSGKVPDASIDVTSASVGGASLGRVTVQDFDFDQDTGSNDHGLTLHIEPNPNTLTDFVDNLFETGQLAIDVVGGAGANTPLTRVMQHFNWADIVNNTGPGTAEGGTFPLSDIAIVDSNLNNVWGSVSTTVTIPIGFEVFLGDLFVEVLWRDTVLGDLSMDDVLITPGNNTFTVTVHLTADNDRALLEQFLSDALFGADLGLITLAGEFTDPSFRAPIAMSYSFVLPPSPGGDDSEIMKCVEISNLDWSLALPATCVLDCTADAYFYNPLPIDLRMNELAFELRFDDPDGALGIYTPIYYMLFTYVDEPSGQNEFELPLQLTPGEIGLARLSLDTHPTDGLERCIRLNDEDSKGQLVLKIRNGNANLQTGNFILDLPFTLPDQPIGTAGESCPEKLGIPTPPPP